MLGCAERSSSKYRGFTHSYPLRGYLRGPRKYRRRRFCGAKYAGVLFPCLTLEYRGFKRLFKSFLQNSNSTFIKSCRYAKESPRLLPCAPLRGGWKQPILCAVGRGRCDCESIAKRVGSEPNASRYDKGENYEQCLVTSRLRLHNSTVGISCQGVFVKNFKKISKPRKKVHKSGNQNIKESLKMSFL